MARGQPSTTGSDRSVVPSTHIRRLSAVINLGNQTEDHQQHHHHHHPVLPPLNLIGANIAPNYDDLNIIPHHELLNRSESQFATYPSAIRRVRPHSAIISCPPITQNALNKSQHSNPNNSPISPSTADLLEDDDEFLPLHSINDFRFPSISSNATTLPSPSSSQQNSSNSGTATNTQDQRLHHNRRHSRIHSRNLSVFFPRPGQPIGSSVPSSPLTPAHPPTDIPVAKLTGWGLDSDDGAFPKQHHPSIPPSPLSARDPWSPVCSTHPSQAKGRRGHHHRHSLSHNFFPFLPDPPKLDGSMQTSPDRRVGSLTDHTHSPPRQVSPNFIPQTPHTPFSAIPKPVPHQNALLRETLPRSRSIESRYYSNLPKPIRLICVLIFHTDFQTQFKVLIGILLGFLSGLLWLKGQTGNSLSVVGLGYLLGFDCLGMISKVWIEMDCIGIERVLDLIGSQPLSQIRLPFGRARKNTLSHFTQAIYMMFSAIYLTKESFERMMINHGPHDGPTNDQSVGNHHHHGTNDLEVPKLLLLVSLFLTALSSLKFRNHLHLKKIMNRYQEQQRKPGKESSSSGLNLSMNQYAWVSIGFNLWISISASLSNSSQMKKMDKLIAVLQVIMIIKLAIPIIILNGKVLLQTLPNQDVEVERTIERLRRVIKDIRENNNEVKSQVMFIERIEIWELVSGGELIGNLRVHVKKEIQENEMMKITEIMNEMIYKGMKNQEGNEKEGMKEGYEKKFRKLELTIEVCKGIERAKPKRVTKSCSHSHGDHSHSHGHHSHSHSDTDDHSHSHQHHHSHSDDHDHSHSHPHDHSHDCSHSHQHAHSHSDQHDHSHSHQHDHSHSPGHNHSHSPEHNHSHPHKNDHLHSHEHQPLDSHQCDHSRSPEHDHSHSHQRDQSVSSVDDHHHHHHHCDDAQSLKDNHSNSDDHHHHHQSDVHHQSKLDTLVSPQQNCLEFHRHNHLDLHCESDQTFSH